MSKLVAFYSRADENYFGGECRYIDLGNTQRVAEMIVSHTGADVFRIEQKEPYAADYDTCLTQAKRDLRKKTRPELVNVLPSISEYEEVYLGYPIYWGDMPMAVYTFLEAYDWQGKTIHPFCTHEGSGLSGTPRQIQKVCRKAIVTPGLSVHGSRVDSASGTVKGWV